ncbi:MAG: hypothetical protein JSS95_08705 [Acidobacteria bacterium]|nr:hypothetical protein [Acidobacteriota bacterium]
MRFHTVATVQVQDSERVLAVLEQRLRAMVSIVVRDGSRITLLGLGPSSRATNQHDTTVIDVWAENGATAIGAEVTFQASAFLGATSQEEIMRLKLERLFEETREQLDLESRHDVARIARMEALLAGNSSASMRVAERPRDAQRPLEADDAATESADSRSTAAQQSDISPSDSMQAGTAVFDSSGPAASSTADVEDEELSDAGYVLDEADGESSNRWILWALLAACIVAALPSTAHYLSTWREGRQTDASQPVAAPAPVSAEPAKPVAAAEPADLLRQWELAMQSRDAAAQASFYAVPVERYFLSHNVSKAQVQADKQQQIDSRKGIWTVKMEKVKITRTAGNTATVSLVKHYMQQEDGKPVKERFVPSQLKLKSEFGVWWITSERNLFATPAPVATATP